MYHTTGFTKDEIIDLCAMVRSAGQEPGLNHWPPILGLFKSVVVALTYMRRNRVQAELAETYGVSQPTISRAVTGITPLLVKALKDMITPIRKPASRNLLDWEKEFNTQVNKIRYVIEQVIANFKTWRIMHTDYRRPLATFTVTISTVIALHFYAGR